MAPPVMKNTSQQQAAKLDILNYGLPDTHKTLAIGKLKSIGFNPLVFACDPGGLTTLNGMEIDFFEIDKPKTAFEILGMIYTNKFSLQKYNLVCIDGASNFSYMCLKATGEDSRDRRLDYANGNINFRRFIDDVRRLPLHVYINAFEVELKNANGNQLQYGAGCEGNKYAIQFTGLMNTVLRSFAYVDDKGATRTGIQTKYDGLHISRERTSSCDMYEPDIISVVKKILKFN